MSKKIEKIEKIEGQETATDIKPEETPAPEDPVVEVEKTFIDRQYEKYCARRAAKAEKKAAKKPMSKGKKAGLIIGGLAVVGGVISAVGKTMLNAASAESCGDEEICDSATGIVCGASESSEAPAVDNTEA